MRLAERIYRALLWLYPRDFREEYGNEMSEVFRARAKEDRVRLWTQVMGDLLLHAPKEHWSTLRQDLRYALRSWRHHPAVPLVAITALTLGMGANVAIFTVANTVLLQPLPIQAPDRLVVVQEAHVLQGLNHLPPRRPTIFHGKNAPARSTLPRIAVRR